MKITSRDKIGQKCPDNYLGSVFQTPFKKLVLSWIRTTERFEFFKHISLKSLIIKFGLTSSRPNIISFEIESNPHALLGFRTYNALYNSFTDMASST